MEKSFLPKTKIGKWSAGLNISFILLIFVSLILILGFKIVSFDSHWWDWTVGIAVPLTIAAFVTGIIAVRKKDLSGLVYFSIFIGACAILFLLSHSLFIND